MNTILLRFNKSLKKITVSRSYSSVDLGHLISHTFDLKDKIVGLTDRVGKFYDLDHVSRNLQTFRNETLTLVVSKELNEDNMSFASSYLEQVTPQKEEPQSAVATEQELTTNKTASSESASMGHIDDLPLFEKLFLSNDQPTVVVRSNNLTALWSVPCYTMHSPDNSSTVLIYLGERKVCELYIDNWARTEEKVREIIAKEQQPEKEKSVLPVSLENKEHAKDYSFEPSLKELAMENLKLLQENEDITELEYLKLKCELLEQTEEFLSRYQLTEESSLENFREALLRSKEAKQRYQKMLSNFRRGSSKDKTREGQQPAVPRKYDIPIIIRKNNNVIQKISTNYPISFEQEHSMNLIAELELKRLATEAEAAFYKSLVLHENQEAEQLFLDYFNDQIDQVELARKLRIFKRRSGVELRGDALRQPEPLMKLILKYSNHTNMELLRRLALESNPKIVTCYENYVATGDEEQLCEHLEKIASYYRIKEDLDEIKPQGRYHRRVSRNARDS